MTDEVSYGMWKVKDVANPTAQAVQKKSRVELVLEADGLALRGGRRDAGPRAVGLGVGPRR